MKDHFYLSKENAHAACGKMITDENTFIPEYTKENWNGDLSRSYGTYEDYIASEEMCFNIRTKYTFEVQELKTVD